MGLRSRVFWGTGAHTASLSPAASFLSSWNQMVNGNECPVVGCGEAAVGGAAGMAVSGTGEQGTVPSPHGTNSFRSVSPPCLTSPGLSMQRQSLQRQEHRHTHQQVFPNRPSQPWYILKIGPFFTNFAHLSCPGTQIPTTWPTKHNALLPLSSPPRLPTSSVEDTFVYNFELLGGLGGRVESPKGGRLQHSFRACGFLRR